MNNGLTISLLGSPFGIGWGFLYGYLNVPALSFLSELRKTGSRLTKVYLFWNQVEPEKGHYNWHAVDAFTNQLNEPEEGLISLFSSSQWAAARRSALLPGSPAINPGDYYHFVYDLVRHCQGRVRYWQNDAEPNNPVYWSGTKEAFVGQLKIFYQAVKDADPAAVVVVGGYDGLFNPPGMPPMHNQQAGLDFFDYVLRDGQDAFDLFDLRLYNNPYTIPGCVDFMRQKMRALGYEKPVICTEYGGPAFFAFAENRQYIPLIASWVQAGSNTSPDGMPGEDNAGKQQIESLYQNLHALAPQTQMFMQGCPAELQAKYERIQARELVIRNILAFSSGVQKLVYWQFLAGSGPRDDLMDLMYGKIGMLEFSSEGGPVKWRHIADVYKRMVNRLEGITEVNRIPCPDQPTVFLYKVTREAQPTLFIVWEQRDTFSGEDLAPTQFHFQWKSSRASAVDIMGNIIQADVKDGLISLAVTDTPVYIE